MHTEDSHLSQIITTFSTGLTALNGLTSQVQYFAVGTSGTDFNISSATDTHTFNLPTASATNRGALSSADWTTFNSKANASGTTNYVSKFTGTTTLGNSQLFDNGTNVGIGTTSPNRLLTVAGTASGLIALNASSYRNTTIGSDSTGNFVVYDDTAGTYRMVINSSGNIGIGTTNPTYPLDVYNTGTSTARIRVVGTSNFALFQAQNTSGTFYMGIDNSAGSGFAQGNYTRVLYSSNSYPLAITVNDVERMRITSAGNVGIGTTSPTSRLTVLNTSSTTAALFGGGVASPAWVSMGTANSGATPFIQGISNSLASNTNLILNPSGGNVGIGTASPPTARLDVRAPGALSTDIALRVRNSADSADLMLVNGLGNVGIGTTSPAYKLQVVNSGNTLLQLNGNNTAGTIDTGFTISADDSKNIFLYQRENASTIFGTNNAEKMRITSGGNVGIGVTVPETKLHIEDVTKVLTNNVAGVAQGTLSLVSTDAQAADIGASLLFGGNYINSNSTRIAYAAITGRKANSSSVNADGYLSFLTWRSTGLTEAMRVTPAGYLGINTTTPAKLLDVNGDALINTLTVGKGAGNQIYNTVLGYQALVNNTTGNDNVAIGYQTLLYNSTGNRNTGIGVATLKLNETGEDNTAVGAVALFNNTTGNGNTAIGYSALNASVDGYANTNIGSACGGLASSPIGTTLIGYDLKYRPSNLSDPLSDSDFAISQYWNEYPGKPHFYAPNKIAIGASTNTEILSVSWDAYNAFFVDYSFDDGGGNLRAGTIKCIFASVSGTFYYELTDDVTPDIGTTTNLSFDVIDDGSHNAVLRVINSDAATYIRFTSRLLFKTI